MANEEADEFNFFADETYFCIKTLLLGHVAAIQIYCVKKGEARGILSAGKKANAFNAAKCNIVGNNATGDNDFGRKRRH